MSFKLLKEMMGGGFTFDTSMMDNQPETNPAAAIFSKQAQDHPDIVSMDVPTMIRIMEWAHEEAKDDVELHRFANALILFGFEVQRPLNMEDYQIVHQHVCPQPENEQGSAAFGYDDDQTEVVYNN